MAPDTGAVVQVAIRSSPRVVFPLVEMYKTHNPLGDAVASDNKAAARLTDQQQ
jgi:hypothetical protein